MKKIHWGKLLDKIININPLKIYLDINVMKKTYWNIENDILKSLYGKVIILKIKIGN